MHLPVASSDSGTNKSSLTSGRFVPRRYYKLVYALSIAGGLVGLTIWLRASDRLPSYSKTLRPEGAGSENAIGHPPDYADYRLDETKYPQHNPDGKTGKYLYFSGHIIEAGWGNALQEHFFQGLLAYVSGRSYAYDEYTWNADGSKYSKYNENLIPSRIPMSVFISGPLAGGPWEPHDPTPRSVTRAYFEQICPEPKILDRSIVHEKRPEDFSALTLLALWTRAIKDAPANCLVIDTRVFDLNIFCTWRAADLMPIIYNSPIIRLFRWSSLIERAFETNIKLFARNKSRDLLPPTASDPYPVIPGLLALHVRRGDFDWHCTNLLYWASEFAGLCQLPGLPDVFTPPVRNPGNYTQQETDDFMRACYPSVEQMIDKVKEIRQTEQGKGLNKIFIMTNGERGWVRDLRDAFSAMGGWKSIATSRDMELNIEQKYVASAVDMLIGQRADVFVGNGFSSLSGNVAMLRMAKGLHPHQTRFWI